MPITLNGTDGIVTPSVQTGGVTTNLYPLVSGTAVASTSGTSIDFTGIPSWVKRITVMFSGVSTNGTSIKQIQLGTSGGVQTTGYSGCSIGFGTSALTNTNYTTGFAIRSASATESIGGTIVLTLLDSSTGIWTAQGVSADSAVNGMWLTAGSKTLSGALDRVRITTVNGTDTFDAGTINILYE